MSSLFTKQGNIACFFFFFLFKLKSISILEADSLNVLLEEK